MQKKHTFGLKDEFEDDDLGNVEKDEFGDDHDKKEPFDHFEEDCESEDDGFQLEELGGNDKKQPTPRK